MPEKKKTFHITQSIQVSIFSPLQNTRMEKNNKKQNNIFHKSTKNISRELQHHQKLILLLSLILFGVSVNSSTTLIQQINYNFTKTTSFHFFLFFFFCLPFMNSNYTTWTSISTMRFFFLLIYNIYMYKSYRVKTCQCGHLVSPGT